MEVGQGSLPEALCILAPHVVRKRSIVQMGHHRLRRKDEPVALLRQAKTQLLILAGLKFNVKTAVGQKYLAAVAGRVVVDKVTYGVPAHVVVAIFIFRLDEAWHKASLFGAERALGAHDPLV